MVTSAAMSLPLDDTAFDQPSYPGVDPETNVTTAPPTIDGAVLEPVPPTDPPADVEPVANFDADEVKAEADAQAARDLLAAELIFVGQDWDEDVVEFEGDKLGVIVPAQEALTAFSLGTCESTPASTRQSMTNMFIQLHTSPTSYMRVFQRLMNPRDPGYGEAQLSALMELLVKKAADKIIAEHKAKEAAEKAAKAAKAG